MTKNDQNPLTKQPPCPNKRCVFPFNWMGKKYYKCTTDDHDKLWCGIQSNVTKDKTSFLRNGAAGWGNCIEHSVCLGMVEYIIYVYDLI